MAREHVFGALFCVEHQIPYEDEPNCWCGIFHPPTLRECAEPCPLWRDPDREEPTVTEAETHGDIARSILAATKPPVVAAVVDGDDFDPTSLLLTAQVHATLEQADALRALTEAVKALPGQMPFFEGMLSVATFPQR